MRAYAQQLQYFNACLASCSNGYRLVPHNPMGFVTQNFVLVLAFQRTSSTTAFFDRWQWLNLTQTDTLSAEVYAQSDIRAVSLIISRLQLVWVWKHWNVCVYACVRACLWACFPHTRYLVSLVFFLLTDVFPLRTRLTPSPLLSLSLSSLPATCVVVLPFSFLQSLLLCV